MSKYIIRGEYMNSDFPEYYLGSTYTFQHEIYPAVGRRCEAMRYTMRHHAEMAMKPLNEKGVAGGVATWFIEEVDE